MFPYFELYKDAMTQQDMPFGFLVQTYWPFFFVVLPLQVSISFYLTIFEVRKMIRLRNYLGAQLLITLYNAFQVFQPLINLLKFVNNVKDED